MKFVDQRSPSWMWLPLGLLLTANSLSGAEAFSPLRLGGIMPEGWLRAQLGV